MATYDVGELPERADEERRRVPLLERFGGVPVVELVDEVGVRRRPPWYCVGYCEFMTVVVVVVVGEETGNMPELVVRVREWPSCASEYSCWLGGGRTATPGAAMGLRRTGIGPKAGAGDGADMTAACMARLNVCTVYVGSP